MGFFIYGFSTSFFVLAIFKHTIAKFKQKILPTHLKVFYQKVKIMGPMGLFEKGKNLVTHTLYLIFKFLMTSLAP